MSIDLPKKANFEYLAGFFDGEGCISVTSPDRGVRVVVTNTRRQSLEMFQEFFGVGRITSKKRAANDSYKMECFQWICYNKEASEVLKKLSPYLLLKKREAELAIEFASTFRKPGSPEKQRSNTKLPVELLAQRQIFVDEIRRLKYV